MAKEICGKTKVNVNGNSYVCKNFLEVWKILEENDYSIDEENKNYLIRVLFISGYVKVDDNLSFEIVWEKQYM